MARPAASLAPMLVAVGGIGVLTCMDGVIKLVSADFPTAQVVMLRYFFGIVSAALVFLAAGTPRPTLATIRPHGWRGVVVTVTAVSFFYALATLPLAVTMALSFTSPILIALFARLTLGERPSGSVALALALGFGGVLVVLGDELSRSSSASLLGALSALISSVAYAVSMVALKSRAARDPVPTIVLLQNIFACLFVSPVAALHWVMPDGHQFLLFVIMGTLGTCGHLCMAWAYGRADASRLGVLEYTAFVWAVVIGLFVFAEVPSIGTLLGAALIVAGATLATRAPKVAALHEPEAEIGP
ncbi:DMT family transporter [Ancylobacter lacus]|uniref:DMT family transporter n=1 Tax=Ancylobacter lacus TaxID=2579970 RepID=UPI001BCF1626|nr:DMT family transporter [Ancylobacter lacus]MBS7540468.1 DMT family transporter [Ancylobacter lacus]